MKDVHSLPVMEDLIGHLGGAQYYSKTVLKSGFWQFLEAEFYRSKTGFVTQDGLYQLKGIPFGLQASCPNFQRLIFLFGRGSCGWNVSAILTTSWCMENTCPSPRLPPWSTYRLLEVRQTFHPPRRSPSSGVFPRRLQPSPSLLFPVPLGQGRGGCSTLSFHKRSWWTSFSLSAGYDETSSTGICPSGTFSFASFWRRADILEMVPGRRAWLRIFKAYFPS